MILDKGLFSDTAVRTKLNQGRLCISCAIQKGSHNKRNLKVNGQLLFGCRGCQKAKPLDQEAVCVVGERHWYEDFEKIGTDTYLASRGCRWCHECWAAIENFRSQDSSPYPLHD